MSCKEDPQPTSFDGVVVYDDDGLPFTKGVIKITSEGNSNGIGTGRNFIELKQSNLDTANGSFNLFFFANDEIESFDILIDNGDINFDLTECGSIQCQGIKPGISYTDLVIEVPRE